MKTRLILAALALAASLNGCVTNSQSGSLDSTLNTWMGKNADELAKQWGPPLQSYRLSDGGRLLQYGHRALGRVWTGTETVFSECTPSYETKGTLTPNFLGYEYKSTTKQKPCLRFANSIRPVYKDKELYCEITFTASRENVLVDWKYKGNDCD